MWPEKKHSKVSACKRFDRPIVSRVRVTVRGFQSNFIEPPSNFRLGPWKSFKFISWLNVLSLNLRKQAPAYYNVLG